MLKIFIVEDKDIVQLYANENHKGMILKKASNLHENTIQPGDVVKISGYLIPDSLMKITHHWGSNPFLFEKYWDVESLIAESDDAFHYSIQSSCRITNRRVFE